MTHQPTPPRPSWHLTEEQYEMLAWIRDNQPPELVDAHRRLLISRDGDLLWCYRASEAPYTQGWGPSPLGHAAIENYELRQRVAEIEAAVEDARSDAKAEDKW